MKTETEERPADSMSLHASTTQHWPRVWASRPPAIDQPLWNCPGRKPLTMLVTIVDTDVGRMFTRIFDLSPIRIGSLRSNELRLRGVSVARCHGEISFAPDLIFFRNRAWTKPTAVNDRRLARGEAVDLDGQSVIAIGHYRIDISPYRTRTRDRERLRKVTPLFVPNAAHP